MQGEYASSFLQLVVETNADAGLPGVCRKPVQEYVTAIEKLQVSDITEAVSKMLKSPPSVAALGDIANIPRYAEVERRFK